MVINELILGIERSLTDGEWRLHVANQSKRLA